MKSAKKQPVVLIVRDGWGIAPPSPRNAISAANTPNIDGYLKKYSNCTLKCSGEEVGLPKGYMGSSEVGHLNMGAGRIVLQELKKIMSAIEDGTLYDKPAFKNAIDNAVKNNSALHLMGLVQDEGVHAHQDHLFAIMKHAKEKGIKKVYIHFFADGRDTPPQSALHYIDETENKIKEIAIGQIATVTGRYYAMDRSKNWQLTDQTYNAITKAEGIKVKTARQAVERAYTEDKNPDGSPITDEYIRPTIVGDYHGVKNGDSVIHFNFRQDRAIQLAKAFVEKNYEGKIDYKPEIVFCGLTRYYDTFKYNALPPMDEDMGMKNLLGEVISASGLKQLRISETQKFRHVTSFFNGKLLKPYPNEDRIEIKGTIDPSEFAVYPQMNALDITQEIERQIELKKYDFILVNFANCDMVGHTGIFKSVIKAVETVDTCTGRVTQKALDNGYTVLITADHGNAEEMAEEKTGNIKTAHSINPVELIAINKNADIKLKTEGILSDIAPTVLELLDIKIPKEMTSQNLIIK